MSDVEPHEGEAAVTVGRAPAPYTASAGRQRLARARDAVMRVYPILRVLAFVVAIGIVAVMAVRAYRSVNVDKLSTGSLALSLPFCMVWWVLLARGWALLVTGRSKRNDISMWCRTQAVRYLPGGIWAPVSRATLLPGTLTDKLATVGAENVIALCAATVVGAVAFAASGRFVWLPLVLVAAVPVITTRFLASRSRVSTARVVPVLWNDTAAFVAYAIAAVLVQNAVSGRTDLLLVAAAACMAWGAGLVVVIAPSGLGVREVVYIALLSGRFTSAEATTGAVVLRAVTIVAELIFLVLLGRPTPERESGTAVG
jgi:hypothetical protein